MGVFPEAKGPQVWKREEAAGPEVSGAGGGNFHALHAFTYKTCSQGPEGPAGEQPVGREDPGWARVHCNPQSNLPWMPT